MARTSVRPVAAAPLLRGLGRDLKPQRDEPRRTTFDRNRLLDTDDLQSRKALRGDRELPCTLIGVHDLYAVDVLDDPRRCFAREGAAIADDVDLERILQDDACGRNARDGDEQPAVDPGPRAQDPLPHRAPVVTVLEPILGGVADQAAGVAHLVHHLIATVDARRAADALVLQALANVDARRTDLHADLAVDAVAQARGLVVELLRAGAARLA